jgi:hypothetical protein
LPKTVDIEGKTMLTLKSGKEGITVDVLCDSFFQLTIGMKLHAPSKTQKSIVKQLFPLLPKSSHPYSSPSTSIIACDQGYNKMNVRNVFWKIYL